MLITFSNIPFFDLKLYIYQSQTNPQEYKLIFVLTS